MSTNATIIARDSKGVRKAIYLHWDGYPSRALDILNRYYTDHEKVADLIELGDISTLRPLVHPKGPHSFNDPEPNVTVAYGRDRGEEGTEAIEVGANSFDTPFVYEFDGEKWVISTRS